jgi:ADP-heptose:LPS heptosyltransferase
LLPSGGGFFASRRTVELIREGRFDVVICYDSSSYAGLLLAAAAAGVRHRIAYVHKGFSCLATHPVEIRYPQPFPCYFRDLVAQITGAAVPQEPRPLVYPSEEDERQAAAVFDSLHLGSGGPVLACSIFSRVRYARYDPVHFIETLRLVVKKTPARLVFLASGAEREMLQALLAESGLPYEIIAGDLGLRALYCFLRRCHAAFVVDSGIRHLANAAGIPVVFARNLYFLKEEAGRYCSTEIDVAPPDIDRLPEGETRHEVIAFNNERAAEAVTAVLLAPPQARSEP